MKTLYVLMFLAAAMATVAALPPLGSLVGLPSFGGSDDTYDDYADVNLFDDGNSTETSSSSEPTTEGPTESTPPTDPDDGDEGLSGGAIAGIVIGSLAGVALIAGGVYYLKVKGLLCFK